MSVGDVLLDIDLANFVLGKHLEASGGADVTVDTTKHSIHGRWLVELWLTASLGPRLGGSCRSACRCSEGPTGGWRHAPARASNCSAGTSRGRRGGVDR